MTIEILIANLPILITLAAACGVLGFLAGHIRRGVVEAKKAAARTPGKLDDFVIGLVEGPAMKLADIVERGDLDAARAAVKPVQDAFEMAKAKRAKR